MEDGDVMMALKMTRAVPEWAAKRRPTSNGSNGCRCRRLIIRQTVSPEGQFHTLGIVRATEDVRKVARMREIWATT